MPEKNQSNKNIVVLGASGSIGRHVSLALKSNTSYAIRELNSQSCNLLDPTKTEEVFANISGDYTLILLSSLNRTSGDPFYVFDANIKMARNLASALKRWQPKNIIYTSSACVYGRPPSEVPLTEESNLSPSNYGLSKYVTEVLLTNNLECPITVLRIPGTFGPLDNNQSVISKFVDKIKNDQILKIYGSGNQIRDFLFVNDLIKAFTFFIDNPVQEIFNLTSGDPRKINDIVYEIGRFLNKRPRLEYVHSLELNEFNIFFDLSKIKNQIKRLNLTPIQVALKSYGDHLQPETIKPKLSRLMP